VQPSPDGEAERLRSRRPRVSVITPSYNQARFLERTIRSVIHQGYANLEYIVIDGGSTDGSVDIIRQYADRLAFWVSESDGGQADAVNKGMARVTCDIVGWVNSDDFYYPGAIHAAVDAFATDPTLGFVYGRGDRVDEHDALIEPFKFTRPFEVNTLAYGVDFILQPTVFMRRGALAAVDPIDPTLQWTLDWDLWIRLGRKFPARLIDHRTAASREYAATKTSKGGFERLEEIQRIVRRHTGDEVSVGYLNYLMFTLLDALPPSRVPAQDRMAAAIHQVAAVCGDLLRQNDVRADPQQIHRVRKVPGVGRRIVRAVVPLPARRVVGGFLQKTLQRLLNSL
jgi:glycosyltransferase involved in cell wall biosynthesis